MPSVWREETPFAAYVTSWLFTTSQLSWRNRLGAIKYTWECVRVIHFKCLLCNSNGCSETAKKGDRANLNGAWAHLYRVETCAVALINMIFNSTPVTYLNQCKLRFNFCFKFHLFSFFHSTKYKDKLVAVFHLLARSTLLTLIGSCQKRSDFSDYSRAIFGLYV